MKNTKWILLSLVMAFIGVPILAHCVALFCGLCVAIIAYILEGLGLGKETQGLPSALILLAVCNLMFFGGRIWSKDNAPEDNLIWRHVILLLPALLALLGWIYALQQAGLDFYTMGSGTLTVLSPWAGIHIVNLVCQWYWGSLLIPVCSQLSFTLGYGWSFRRSFFTSRAGICRSIILFLIVLASAYAAYQAWQQKLKYPNVIYEDRDTRNYQPDKWHNELIPLQGKPALQITHNWPRMDGATAGYPLYASAFYALNVLPKRFDEDKYLLNSRTPAAWENIIKGRVDIIFVAQPSAGQKSDAQKMGVKLTYTPFAREAFVFIVNKNNPINSLTTEQVRDIFSGKITNWRQVGGPDAAIEPWQRPEDSGSQTAMLAKVMKGTPMLKPREMKVADQMGELLDVVAQYQDTPGAIGYTFRYYATRMHAREGVKLLAINGIAPTAENIRNEVYPWVAGVYMVTQESPTKETQKVVAWFLSPQGQRLVQDVGYVPMHETSANSGQ